MIKIYSDIVSAAAAVAAGDAILLDVRTHAEHTQQSAVDAIHLDVYEMQTGADPQLSKNSNILVQCRSGGRAGIACELLLERGYKNVQNVGGLDDWLKAIRN